MAALPSPSRATPHFMAFVNDDASQETLRAFAIRQGLGEDAIHRGTIVQATEYLKSHPAPQVIMVEIPNAEEAAKALDALADVCPPEVKVLVTGNVNEYSFYMWLTDIGIAGYLLKPFSLQGVELAFQRAQSPAASAQSNENKTGKVIAVWGARGGVGATTVAVNVAYLLSHPYFQSTALLDLDPQFGTVATALDIECGRGIRDAFEKPDRIDGLFLDRVMVRYSDRLAVLSGEEALEETIQINEQAIGALIQHTRSKYEQIVIDLPAGINAATRRVLSEADHVLVVSGLTLIDLRDTMRILDYMRDTLKISPPHVVFNRVGIGGKKEMPSTEFEKTLNTQAFANIPYTQSAFAATTEGDVLVKMDKENLASKALVTMVEKLLPNNQPTTKARGKKPDQSLLGKWLKK